MSDCKKSIFLIDSSVEKILSVWVVTESEFGNDVDSNSSCTPSGLITNISRSGAQLELLSTSLPNHV